MEFNRERVLFADAAFQLNPGERYGIVGANGCGKTTLLSILSGDAPATTGTVSIPKALRLGVLRQDQFLYEHEKVLSVALMGLTLSGQQFAELPMSSAALMILSPLSVLLLQLPWLQKRYWISVAAVLITTLALLAIAAWLAKPFSLRGVEKPRPEKTGSVPQLP